MGDLLHSSLLTLTLTMFTCPRADYPSHYAGSKIKKFKWDPDFLLHQMSEYLL